MPGLDRPLFKGFGIQLLVPDRPEENLPVSVRQLSKAQSDVFVSRVSLRRVSFGIACRYSHGYKDDLFRAAKTAGVSLTCWHGKDDLVGYRVYVRLGLNFDNLKLLKLVELISDGQVELLITEVIRREVEADLIERSNELSENVTGSPVISNGKAQAGVCPNFR